MSSPLDKPHTWLDALIYFTDCQIATFDSVAARKGSPKADLKRHHSIAVKMLTECQAWHADAATVLALAQRLTAAEDVCAKVHGIRVWET